MKEGVKEGVREGEGGSEEEEEKIKGWEEVTYQLWHIMYLNSGWSVISPPFSLQWQ